jgi:hypothetical protein
MTTSTDLPATFAAARDLNPYTLARAWADSAGADHTSAEVVLAELATMRALAHWLTRWAPIHIHRALLADASVEQVCAAYGSTNPAYELASPAEVALVWQAWADWQRRIRAAGSAAGMNADEFDRAAAVLGLPASAATFKTI